MSVPLLALSLPLTNPVLIFSLVLFIILLAPILLNRFRIPALVGLILAGALVGPNGFNLLLRDASIQLFGTVGLLYIMFLAGLEIDLNEFRRNKHRSAVFGFLTFSIPMALGLASGTWVLGYPLITAILLASMYASHTLLAYPIVSRLGISKHPVVNVSVGGTMITDTAALLVLTVIASWAQGELTQGFWIRIAMASTLVFALVLWGGPILARWFFKNFEDGVSQYIFVLGMLFLAASLAAFASLEPIIGAFLAGLALNRLISSTSPLMSKIEFVGNALFIPFFLIGVGMLVDYRVLLNGPRALLVAGVMTVVATSSKWLAAFLTQKIYGYTRHERQVMFGLSNAQAAATLAAVMIGFQLNIFSEEVLNGSVIMILVTCVISSFAAERAGKALAIAQTSAPPQPSDQAQRILVPISNPNSMEGLMSLALAVRAPASTEKLYPLAVVMDDEHSQRGVITCRGMLEQAVRFSSAANQPAQMLTRVDVNTANGIIRASKELLITDIVIGWNTRRTAQDFVFGSVLDRLTRGSHQMLLVNRFTQPINTIRRALLVAPENAEHEAGFARWVYTCLTMAQRVGISLVAYAPDPTSQRVKLLAKAHKSPVKLTFRPHIAPDDILGLGPEVRDNDLLVVVTARRGSISYRPVMEKLPSQVARHFEQTSFIILFPERLATAESEGVFLTEP